MSSELEGGNIQSNMSMDTDVSVSSESNELTMKQDHVLFKRQVLLSNSSFILYLKLSHIIVWNCFIVFNICSHPLSMFLFRFIIRYF